jgi:hypothetical protein
MDMNTDTADELKLKDISRAAPIDQESLFRLDELFFSITDRKSTITYANDVFIRVSKFPEEEIHGQLHKIIRHPEMPRAVFHLFWSFLKKGKPVAAYVKNMAKDGSYYWVVALAFPCRGGYLSIRLKPQSPLFQTVKTIYANTLAYEKEQEAGTDKKSAMLAAEEFLVNQLREAGFSNYNEFMWNALQAEMKHRETALNKSGSDRSGNANRLNQLEDLLRELVLSLEQLKEIHWSLMEHSDYLIQLSRSILLLSLNAQVSSAKLDTDDMSLSVIAENMGEQSVSGESKLREIQNTAASLSDLIGTLNFDIVSTKLQVEMTIEFLKQLTEDSELASHTLISHDEAKQILYDAFLPGLGRISDGIGKLPGFLRSLMTGVNEIDRFLLVLRFIHTSGRVEVARMNRESGSFANTFRELIREVGSAEQRLEQLSDVIETHQAGSKRYEGIREKLRLLKTAAEKEK